MPVDRNTADKEILKYAIDLSEKGRVLCLRAIRIILSQAVKSGNANDTLYKKANKAPELKSPPWIKK